MASIDIQYCHMCRMIPFAAVPAGTLRNNSGNSDIEPVAGLAGLSGRTAAVVCTLFVGILWVPGIPGCSCSTGCKMPQYHTVAAVAVGCKLTVCWFVVADCSFVDCSSVGSVASDVGLIDFDDTRTDADDNLHCHHGFHHHNHRLIKKANLQELSPF